MNLSSDWLLPNLYGWKSSTAQVVGEGGSVSWGGAKTKGEGFKCELTRKMLFHSDLLQLCQNKKRKITELFPDNTVFNDLKTRVAR